MTKITREQIRAIKLKYKHITGTPGQYFRQVAADLGVHPTTVRRICLPRGKKQEQHKIEPCSQLAGRWYTTMLMGMIVMSWDFLGHDPHTKKPGSFWWDRQREQYRCQPDEHGERRFEPYLRADDIIHIWQKMMRPHTQMAFISRLMRLSDSKPLDMSLLTPKMVCEAALLVKGYLTHDQLEAAYQAMGDKS